MVILITFLLLFVSIGNAAPESRDRFTSPKPVVTNEQVHGWLHALAEASSPGRMEDRR